MTQNKKEGWEIESFDSFFAGLPMKLEKNAIKLYEKYIKSRIRSLLHEREEEMVKKLLELIEKHDPSSKRKTSKAYWGNTLRDEVINKVILRK